MTTAFQKRLSYRLTRDTVLIAMVLGLVLNIVQVTLDYFSARDSMEQETVSVDDLTGVIRDRMDSWKRPARKT